MSYVFEGWNIDRERWIVLLERSAPSGNRPSLLLCFDQIDTEMEFTRFRFRHTDKGFAHWKHIGMNSIEIHGDIRVIEHCGTEGQQNVWSIEEFDPWAIPDWR
jgi:hypothetical protein